MATPQLLTADVDVLVMDSLAEVTMSLLARALMKDPTAGYPPDFVRDLADTLPAIAARGIRVVTNAGGVIPRGCAEANAAKYLAADACFNACDRAVRTHGGMGYAAEFDGERYFREAVGCRLAPVSRELVLCYLAERVLGLPKSY
jgi:alkylation response protein AidB-like acyl-CoA dehydrogenase